MTKPSRVQPARLPSWFELPTPSDLDDVIENLNQDIIEEGGPSAFLGEVRNTRRSWRSMEYNVLRPLSVHAFCYEDIRALGKPPKTDLAISRAALSGMLFGHIVNEGVYPNALYEKTYHTDTPINPELTDEFEDFEALWEKDQPKAYKLGVQAMSTLFIDSLSDTSLQTLSQWGGVTVGADRMQHFNFGFGTSLYLAWDAYSDAMLASGNVEKVQQYINTNLTTK